jgi:glucose/arabinose dehydrogenase
MPMRYAAALTLIALAGCSHEQSNMTTSNVTEVTNTAEPANAAAPAGNAADVVAPPATQTAYLGKWIGPEGLVLEVTAKPDGGVAISNQWTLDDKGKFEGSVTAEGLRWMRGNTPVTAVLTDGDATGMKWLAGKKTCLTVTAGSEGYCRD